MRKIKRIVNIALIFMLIGTLACQETYGLRPPLIFNKSVRKLVVPSGQPMICSDEFKNIKSAIYPGYFYIFDEMGIDVIRSSLKVYEKIILLVLTEDPQTRPEVLQGRVERVYKTASEFLNPKELNNIMVVGVYNKDQIVPFLKEAKISGMIRKFHRVESPEKLKAEAETSRINYEDYGLQTIFAIPSYQFLELPDDKESKRKDEIYRKIVTALLRAKYPDVELFFETLTRQQFEELIENDSVLELLGEELSEIDPNVAFYAGSFDPITYGHLEVLLQAANVYKEVIVGIGHNPNKLPMFTSQERKALIEESLRSIGITNVKVVIYDVNVPTVKVAGENGAGTLLRGARNVEDLRDELVLAWINQILDSRFRTILVTPHQYENVSSTKLKEEYLAGGDISKLVAGPVFSELIRPHLDGIKREARIIGLVGGIGAGKSTVLKLLQDNENTEVIDLDQIGHRAREDKEIIAKITRVFGAEVLTDGQVDRIKLRGFIFKSDQNRFVYDSILRSYMLKEIYKVLQQIMETKPDTRLIVLEGVRIVEEGLNRFMDGVWYIDAPEGLRIERVLKDKGRIPITRDMLLQVIDAQRVMLANSREKASIVFDNSKDPEHLERQVRNSIAAENLRRRWAEVLSIADVSDKNNDVFMRIMEKYMEPHRYYHTTTHIESIFRIYDELIKDRSLDEILSFVNQDEIAAFMFAIFLHDIVYNADHIGKDEDESVKYAETVLSELGVARHVIDRTKYLIALTKTHEAESADVIAQLFMDLDVTILGANWEEFIKYDRGIRREFIRFPFADYIKGRKSVLQGFEQKTRIYNLSPIQDRFGNQAKQNLRRIVELYDSIDISGEDVLVGPSWMIVKDDQSNKDLKPVLESVGRNQTGI